MSRARLYEDRCLSRSPRWWYLSIALAALVGTLAIYPASLAFDLHIDDFVSLRPWPADVLWRSLTGTWHDFPGAPAFYRPIPTLYYAAAFWLFGVNAAPLHVLPLVVVPLCGWLTGVFVWRESLSRGAAALAALLFVVHPGTTISIGPWIANQYHGFAIVFTLTALLWWQRCRDRPLAVWTPLAVPLVLAGFTKEDALMLPLVLVSAQWVIARWTGTLRAPSRAIVLAALGLFGAMNAWRWLMLGGAGGYAIPPAPDMVLNLLRGPYFILVVQLGSPLWAVAATTLSTLCAVAALISVVRERTEATTRIALTGGVLLALANLPLALMTSMSRSYLLTLGAVLIVTTGAVALWRWIQPGRAWASARAVSPGLKPGTSVLKDHLAAAMALALLVVPFTALSRERLQIYAPCSEATRLGDEWTRDERLPYLAPEFGPWLNARIASCDPATYRPLVETLPVATWRLPDGSATVLVTDTFGAATLQVRSPVTSADAPVHIGIVINGNPAPAVSLTTPGWVDVPLTLTSSWRTRLRRSHRIDVRAGGDTAMEVRVVNLRQESNGGPGL